MNTTKNHNETKNVPLRFLNKKEFGQYIGRSNRQTINSLYHDYLLTVGKSPGMLLSTFDVYKIDGVYPD